jgi:hypothetical protein
MFFYSRDRGGEHPRRHLSGWVGTLQADAYAGFNDLYDARRRPGRITEAACWAHGRRKFFVLADLRQVPLAIEAVRRIDEISAVEREINGVGSEQRHTLSLVVGGNTSRTTRAPLATPLFQNKETVLNLIYTCNAAPWTVTPYLQYTHVPTDSSIGAFQSPSTYGGAVLANYKFADDSPLPGVRFPIRFE